MRRPGPLLTLVLILALTWAFWVPAALTSRAGATLLTNALHYAGGLVPLAVTLVLLYRSHSSVERRDYWRRAIGVSRIPARWYLPMLLIAPLLTGLGAAIDVLLGGPGFRPALIRDILTQPLSAVPYALFLLVFGPVPEELAWRGYLLDRLQAKNRALIASLILGVVWTLWHLPLSSIQGTYQHSLGLGTAPFRLYMLDKVPQSILMTWIYNNTRRSTLSAILFHYSVNLTGELLDLTLRAETAYVGLWIAAAVVVTLLWGSATLSPSVSSDACLPLQGGVRD